MAGKKGKKGAKAVLPADAAASATPAAAEPAQQATEGTSAAPAAAQQPASVDPAPGPSSAPGPSAALDVASEPPAEAEAEGETASTASKKKKKKKKKGAGGGAEATDEAAGSSATPKEADKGAGDALSQDVAKMSVAAGGPSKRMYAIPQKIMIKKHDARTCLVTPKIEVNYLQITFKSCDIKLYHYDVTFNPEKPKSLLRPAIEKFFKQHCKNRYPAFDGVKNVYAAKSTLPFRGDLARDTVEVADPEDNGRMRSYDITIKLTQQTIQLSQLMKYMKEGRSQEIPQDVIQATDIALRNGLYKSFIPCGRSFFSGPMPQTVPLGGGMELYDGFFQSAIMGQGKAFLNVDVSNKAFPIQQTVLEYLTRELHVSNYNNELEPRARGGLQEFLKGLKVNYELRGEKRTYRVNGLGQSARDYRFKPADKPEMSVEQYFRTVKNYPLKYPRLPLLHVGPSQKNTMIPLELCRITGGQTVMRKLDDKQTAAMVKAAARPTDERKARILKSIQSARYHESEVLTKEFDIAVSTKFHEVQSYVFKPPKIRYKAAPPVMPNNGEWRMDRHTFFTAGPGLKPGTQEQSRLRWAILIKDFKTKSYDVSGSQNTLAQLLPQCARALGIQMDDVSEILESGDSRKLNERDIESELNTLAKRHGLQIVIVILPGGGPGSKEAYGNIKRASEFRSGVLTQCLKAFTATKKMNSMTANNILLKMNAKVNGVNHALDPESKPKRVFSTPVMFVGADVTHPAPGSEGSPSIAAVAASFDVHAFKYKPVYRLQGSRQEMIVDLADMMDEQLKFFHARCSRWPTKILYYRDGVSEGQFNTVMEVELTALKRACTKLGVEALITFLVVQKRHHTRFFPSVENSDRSNNRNVLAGTVVDTDITHPTEMDFYLVSHKSIQGTARPTKYHLLYDDNNFDCEELEMLTYYLCYMFARCNRAVSYPAPTYYAHLAAFRARAWWDGQKPNLGNLMRDQTDRGQIHENILRDNPMFFV